MQSNTAAIDASRANFATRRPHVAAGMVSVAGLAVGFALAFFATELAHSLAPASLSFISASGDVQRQG